MDILGVGLPELIMIALILLVVAGPKRAVRWAYTLGHEAGKLRDSWQETQDMIRNELEAAATGAELPTEFDHNSIVDTAGPELEQAGSPEPEQ